MILTRRRVLEAGGVFLAGVGLGGWAQAAGVTLDIAMAGTANGSAVWFDPTGLHVAPGTTVRWTNADRGNSHTTTAYHPANGRPLRIPAAAQPWDSGYLLPGATFAVLLTVPGIYDYFCRPHEAFGMVGRLVVGAADPAATLPEGGVPAAALAAFPAVADILRDGSVAAPRRP